MFAGFSDIFDSVPTWCATSPRPYITTNIFSIHIHNFTQILLKEVLVAAKAPTDLESSRTAESDCAGGRFAHICLINVFECFKSSFLVLL